MKPERTNRRPQPWPLTVSAKTQPGALLFVTTEQMTQWAAQDTHRKGWLSSSKSEYLRNVWGRTFLLFSCIVKVNQDSRAAGHRLTDRLLIKLQARKETSFYINIAGNLAAVSKCLAKTATKVKDKTLICVVVVIRQFGIRDQQQRTR